MPPDQEERFAVQESPEESRGEADAAKAAADSQVKPPDLVEKERQQADLRERRKTPSSTSLPLVQLFESAGAVVVKVADTVVKLGNAVSSSSDTRQESHCTKAISESDKNSTQAVAVRAISPVEIAQVNDNAIAEAAKTIYEACEGKVEAGDSKVLKFLKKAGTNDEAIIKTLESMTEVERQRLAQVYEQEHKIPLHLHLLSEMETPEEQEYMMRLLTRKDGEVVEKRKSKLEIERERVDHDKITESAEVLHDELGTGWTDHERVSTTLESLSEAERDVLRSIYQEPYGETLKEALESEYSGEDEKHALALLYCQDASTQADGVDSNAMEKTAEAIRKAMDGADDVDTVYTLLKDKTEAERKIVDAYYKQKTGLTLEEDFRDDLSGAELDRALNVMYRKDGSSDHAGRIHTALIERGQVVEGRDDEECERDIRETLATMNSHQIEQLGEDYQRRYDQSLEQALLEDDNVSDATKDAIAIYLKGADARTDEDSLQLADVALKAQDIDMYKEVMSKASPKARQAFMDSDGEQRLDEAFGTKWYGYIPHVAIYGRMADAVLDTNLAPNLTDTELRHATNYAQEGKLSAETELIDNQSWLGDNERAIEQTLANLSTEDRDAYKHGRNLAAGKDVAGLSEEQKVRATEYYNALHEQLRDAGDATEIARWEDMIAQKGGTLISELTAHDGITDDVTGAIAQIENMSEEDWDRLKSPQGDEFRKEIEQTLGLYLSETDVARCMEIIYIKKAMSSFEDATASGRRSIAEALKDAAKESFKFYGQNVDENEVYRLIREMSSEDQNRYRSDARFKEEVDDLVTSLLDGREEDAALHMLKNVEDGRTPGDDILSKLRIHAADTDTDEAQVIRDVVREFKENPAVRDKVLSPGSADDQEFKDQFEDALRTALGSSDFEKYGKPLVDSGHLSLDLQMQLNKGIFGDDEHGYYQDILSLVESGDDWSKTERERILTDEAYQEKVFDGLSEDERQVATYVLEQGEMKPEDKIRSYVLGAGTGEREIKEVLAQIKPDEKERLKGEYARKYGEDLAGRLLDELGGQDAIDVKRAMRREYEDSRSAFDEARDEYYESRSGFGSDLLDAVWDGTGYQADGARLAFVQKMAEYAAKGQEMPADERKVLMQNLQQSMDLFRESKGAMADAVTDAYIAAACVAAGFVTDGGGWALLGALASGGFLKAGGKAAIMGADYDLGTAPVDFAAGGVDAALNMITFGAGSSAAKAILKEGGEVLLKKGTEEALEKGLVDIARTSIKEGTLKISDDAVKELVDTVVREGADKEALERLVRENLPKAIKEEAESTAEKLLVKEVLPAVEGGAIGGGGSGAVHAVAEWDSEKSFAENMAMVGRMAGMSAAFGAGGGVVGVSVFKVGGKAFQAIAQHYRLEPGEKLSAEQLADLARKHGGNDAAAHYNDNGGIEITSKFDKPVVPGNRAPDSPDPAWAEPGRYKFDDGSEMEVLKLGKWVQPIENIPNIPADAKGVKAHVFTSDARDLEILQKVLMKSLRDDPDLVGHVSWKTFDPKKTPDGAAVGHGQARKAFTLEARSPEELARVARKIDEILAKHPELKPVAPEGVDQLVGTSGRVAIVRDRFPIAVDAAGVEGAKLHETLSERILRGLTLERDTASGKLTEDSLRAIEKRLREVEDAAQLKPDSLALDKDGNLMLRPTSDHSGALEGKYYLDEHKAQVHPRGAEYQTRVPEVDLDGNPVLDPATGEPRMIEKAVKSEGLTDRPAYYKLTQMYGADPALEIDAARLASRLEAADVSPSIQAIGARADIPEEEWAARVAYIGENALARPEVIDSFLRKAADATSKWDDRSFLNTVLEKSADDLRCAVSRYKEIVSAKQGVRDGSADRELIKLLDKPEEVRLRFKDDPDVQHALDEYYRAREIHANVARDLHDVTRQRATELQQLLNDFADERGLPRAELIVTDDAHMVGAYGTYGDGVIRLRESNVLRINDPLKLMETAYHEFAHNAQDSLMIRSVVDEVESRVGRSLTPDVFDRIRVLNKRWVEAGSLSDTEMTEMVDLERSISEVRKRYAEVSGGGIHGDHLREILRARDGKRLTAEELERAEEVAAAWRKNAPPGDRLIKLGNDLEVTRGELQKLDLMFGEHKLVQRLIDDNGTLSRHLFGADGPPPEVRFLMDTYRSGDSVPERWVQARAVLQTYLRQRQDNVLALCKQINKDYMQFHEQEAFVLGASLRELADSLGITGRPPFYYRSGNTVPDGPVPFT